MTDWQTDPYFKCSYDTLVSARLSVSASERAVEKRKKLISILLFSISGKPPCGSNNGGYNGFQGYGYYPGYSSYKHPVSLSFQSPIAPTPPQYAVSNNAPSIKHRTDTAPIKARPTAVKAATRRISFEDGEKTKQNPKDASPQIKQIISGVDDQAEYNRTDQSYAGYNVRENEKQFYGGFSEDSDGKGVFPEKDDSASASKEQYSSAVQQPEKNADGKLPENYLPKNAAKDTSQQNEDDSSKPHDYKDEIEKEAVEQEKEADEKAEKEGSKKQGTRHDGNIDEDVDDEDDDLDDDDDDEDDDSNDTRDEDENDNDDDDDKEKGRFNDDSMRQENRIDNPADQSFAVSPQVLPGMCPPCRK